MARDEGPTRGKSHEVSSASLEQAIAPGDLVLLDTSSLAAYFGSETTSPSAIALVDSFIRSGRNRAVVSAVTAAELLVRPLRAGEAGVSSAIGMFLRTFPNLDVVPVDLTVAAIAAELRAGIGMKLPDALIAACGLDRSAVVAVSDDRGWPDTLTRNEATMRTVSLRSTLA